jgi:hypothetical protein
VDLPARLAVRPIKTAALLTVFAPINPLLPYSYRYNQHTNWGIYAGPNVGNGYPYALPFKPETKWKWGLAEPATSTAKVADETYFFALPPASPICAMREGLVANVVHSYRKNTVLRSNYITIYHDDGSYAQYLNLQQYSASVAIGQRVAQGQCIALSSAEKTVSPLHIGVLRPGLNGAEPVPFTFETTPVPVTSTK